MNTKFNWYRFWIHFVFGAILGAFLGVINITNVGSLSNRFIVFILIGFALINGILAGIYEDNYWLNIGRRWWF